MIGKPLFFIGLIIALIITFGIELSIGATIIPLASVADALFNFDPENYDHFVVLYQRVPRALIAIYAGALMACSGIVLQGLTHNPLASPSTLGINAGAMLFVLAGAYFLDLGTAAQGTAALVGGAVGFACAFLMAKAVGFANDPRGLTLILSGSLISMLLFGIANAILLTDPTRRGDFLSWALGNINHVYIDRLYDFWWMGIAGVFVLFYLARPLTLITLGADKAVSTGVNVKWVVWLALIAVTIAASSAVAVCGPIGFVGLIVPHIVRPFTGSKFTFSLPGAALLGATICLLADFIARQLFAPYVLHTGLVMDLIGGIVFILIVRHFYLSPRAAG